jgi:flagellar FliL protein
MAKKPRKGAAPEAEGEEGAAAEKPKGGKKKLLLLAGLGLLVLGGGGGGAYVFLLKSKAPAAEQAEIKKPVAFLDIREMTVNLAPEPNQERPRFLRFKVALEVKEAKVVPEIQPLLPRVEDAFQVFVRELRASDLEGSAGVYRLREELLRRVNVAVYPAKVDAVLFKDIVVQ